MSDTTVKTTGRVKWFNKNSGYGFITAVDGDHCGEDIFVHHSVLNVEKDQFRYLVDGEYVTFVWSESGKDSQQHKWQASSVTGVCAGPLLCETQNSSRDNASSRGDGEGDDGEDGSGDGSSGHQQRRYRGGAPRFTDSNGGEYRLVRNHGNKAPRTGKGRQSSQSSQSSSME